MRRNHTNLSIALLFTGIFFAGCKKETDQTKAANDNFFSNENKSSCRLIAWRGFDDGYFRKLEYNKKGLLEKWTELVPLAQADNDFTFKYDVSGKITEMRSFDHGNLTSITIPVYYHNRVAKELWYLSDNVTLDDQIINTYDRKGQIINRTSLNYDYIASFFYDGFGNIIGESSRSQEGFLYDSVEQSFDKNVKEPMMAVPGWPYPMPYINYLGSKQQYRRLR